MKQPCGSTRPSPVSPENWRRRVVNVPVYCSCMTSRLSNHPNAVILAEAYSNLGNALKELGDLEGASQFYKKVGYDCSCGSLRLADELLQFSQHRFQCFCAHLNMLVFCVCATSQAISIKPRFCDAYNNLAAAFAQLGNTEAAIQSYQTALAINPTLHDAQCNLGNMFKQRGRLADAKASYLESIRLRPDFAIAWSNLAGLVKEMGDVAGAIATYREAVRLDPSFSDAWSNMGNAFKEAGQLDEAKAAYVEAIRLRPTFAIAHGNLASCFYDEGDMRRAVDEYALAINLEPNFPDAYNNLGNAYRELGMVEESVRCYRTALQLKPDHAHAYNNLGNSLKDKGLVKEAIHCYMTACRLMPSFAAAHSNLASILKEQGKVDVAVAHYHAAVRADPMFADAYSNMGNAYKDVGRLGDAIKCYAMAIRLRPNHGEALSNLASAFKDCGRVEEAIVCYRRALQLKPNFPDAFSNLVHSLCIVCDWRQRSRLLHGLFGVLHQQQLACTPEMADCPTPGTTTSWDPRHATRLAVRQPATAAEQAVEQMRLLPGAVLGPVRPAHTGAMAGHLLPSVQPFHSLVYPLDVREMQDLAVCYAARAILTARAASVPAFHMPRLHPHERLRVGYVSSDFGNHPLSHLMQSVFGMHDKSRFEVFCFALSPNDGSTWRAKIEREVEHAEDLTPLSFADCAKVINSRGIHLLVNLNGYTKGARNEIFALRPAPVQVSYMGFCGTMGAKYMDYFVVDRTVVPPHLARHYTETLAYMPHSYFVNDHKQSSRFVLDPTTCPPRAKYGIPAGAVVFANFNQLYKIDPVTFEAWSRILKAVPGSVLWLLRFPPAGELQVRRAARAFGLSDDRVLFTDVAPKDEHISRGRLADIFLDTPMCNAHTTACDILWSGVPVVTVPGEKMACRVAASLLNAAGLRECIATSLEDYVRIAVELGRDGPRRAGMRARLEAARDTLPAFDTARWTRNLEAVYTEMWRQFTSGRRGTIVVPDSLDGRVPEPYTDIHFSRTPEESCPSPDALAAAHKLPGEGSALGASSALPVRGSMYESLRGGGKLPASHPEAVIEAFVCAHQDVRERTAEEVAYNALIQPAPPLPPGPAAAVAAGASALPPAPIPAISPPPGLVLTASGVAIPAEVAAAAAAGHLTLPHSGNWAAAAAATHARTALPPLQAFPRAAAPAPAFAADPRKAFGAAGPGAPSFAFGTSTAAGAPASQKMPAPAAGGPAGAFGAAAAADASAAAFAMSAKAFGEPAAGGVALPAGLPPPIQPGSVPASHLQPAPAVAHTGAAGSGFAASTLLTAGVASTESTAAASRTGTRRASSRLAQRAGRQTAFDAAAMAGAGGASSQQDPFGVSGSPSRRWV